MSQFAFHASNWSAVAVADTTALVTAQHMSLQGTSATQRTHITEIEVGGLASTTSPSIMQWARCTVAATTPTALASPNSAGPKDASAAALASPVAAFVAASTPNQRSAAITDAKLDLSFNAFGGIVRWNVPWQESWSMIGNTQPLGVCCLSAFTGSTTASVSAHIVYETL
jgi:hypothetical protein